MGLRQCDINKKKLAEILGLDSETIDSALKESRAGGFARIWSIEDKGNYTVAKVSTSKKRKDNSGYDQDFQDGFVRLIGSAHEKAKEITIPTNSEGVPLGVTVQITSCESTTPYDAVTKKGYNNYAIFAFDIPNGNDSANATPSRVGKKSTAKTSKAKKNTPVEDEADDDLPF